jgi:hypothetical protein
MEETLCPRPGSLWDLGIEREKVADRGQIVTISPAPKWDYGPRNRLNMDYLCPFAAESSSVRQAPR